MSTLQTQMARLGDVTADPLDPADFRAALQTVIEEFLDGQADRLTALGDDAARLIAEARVALGGGKRFRAAFCYWVYRTVAAPSADEEQALLRACAALEFL